MGSPAPGTGDQELHSPFQAFLPFPRTSDSEAAPSSHAPAAPPGQHPAAPSPASAQKQHAATLPSTCALPARRSSLAAEEASAAPQLPEHSLHSSHHSRGSLESVLSCRLTAAELMGPREVRTLLPGVQTLLRACGVESHKGALQPTGPQFVLAALCPSKAKCHTPTSITCKVRLIGRGAVHMQGMSCLSSKRHAASI